MPRCRCSALCACSVVAGNVTITVTGNGSLGSPFSIILSGVEATNIIAAAGATETLPDVGVATLNRLTLDAANCVLTFPAPVAGKSFTLSLKQDAVGGRTVTWPASVVWPGGVAPTLTVAPNKVDVFSFMADDATNWRGFVAGQNYA